MPVVLRQISIMKFVLVLLVPLVRAAVLWSRPDLDDCPGYKASNIKQLGQRLTADLNIAGDACDTYGSDIPDLKLLVEEQSGKTSSRTQRLMNTYQKQKTAFMS